MESQIATVASHRWVCSRLTAAFQSVLFDLDDPVGRNYVAC